MSSEVKHYWPEEIVGTGELVVYLQDYAALEAECKILRNSLAGSNNQARANKLEAEKFAIDWLKVLEERDALAADLQALKAQMAEPVGYQYQGRDGEWRSFIDQRHYENTVAAGTWPIRAIYAASSGQEKE